MQLSLFFSDFTYIFVWWFVLFSLGTLSLPFITVFFHRLVDKGYIFSKIFSIALLSYAILILGLLQLLAFTQFSIIITIVLLILFALFPIISLKSFSQYKTQFLHTVKTSWRIFLLEEIFFLLSLFLWSIIRGYQPDIYGLEKYMDFGFVNTILRSESFPPKDIWFTPFTINYYYFGHFVTAVLTKLSGVPSFISYNLMLATLFAFTFVGIFSITLTLFYQYAKKNFTTFPRRKLLQIAMLSGVVGGLIAALGGNLHTIYAFFIPYTNEHPQPFWELVFSPGTFPNAYWYPNATRFIPNTIHEFPLYSFVVSDLHGHVLDIPFVLFTIAALLQIFLSKKLSYFPLILVSFSLAIMYMTNAWDGIIYFLLATVVLFVLSITYRHPSSKKVLATNNLTAIINREVTFSIGKSRYTLYIFQFLFSISLLGVGFLLFSLPFSLFFKPFVSGFGILCSPEFLQNIEKIGPLLFERDHCQRSPWWQLFILHGFFYLWIILFFVMLLKKMKKHSKLTLFLQQLASAEIFIILLIFISTVLIIIPEFIYAKDIYPDHYRANTMFKLVYQSFLMLSIVAGYIIVRTIVKTKRHVGNLFVQSLLLLLIFIPIGLLFLYPYFAINSYYNNLQTYKGLNGIQYLKDLHPDDYKAILWINTDIKGQPVVLEAQGDSYTDYARISANTGLPTVLGWTVHEWLWRGSYDIPSPRIAEIQTMYETNNVQLAKDLLDKYHVQYVYVGDLERQKYQALNEEKFHALGDIVFTAGNTRIFRIR